MFLKRAPLGAVLAFAACATAAPEPQPSETAPPTPTAEGDAAQDATATPMRMGAMAGGRMHAHGMSGDTLRGPHMQGRHTHDQGMGADRMQGRHMQDRPVQAPIGEEARGGMGMRMSMGQEAPAAPRETPAHLQEGERVFRDVCSQCHTMDPPPNLAPPMSHVARHLREAFTDEDGAVAHVKSYLPSPEAERSILPEMARERFGLMPAQPLSPELLEAVGRYIWFLGSPQG